MSFYNNLDDNFPPFILSVRHPSIFSFFSQMKLLSTSPILKKRLIFLIFLLKFSSKTLVLVMYHITYSDQVCSLTFK